MGYYQGRIIELSQRQSELFDYLKNLEKEDLPNSPNAFSHWQRYQEGILYCSGGWGEQPKWYTEDMHYIGLKMELEEIPSLLIKYQATISEIIKADK